MGLLRTAGRTAVIAGTATRVSNNVNRRQHQKWAQQDAAAAAPPPAPAAPAPVAAPVVQDDLVEQLRKLGALRDEGILTEEEFAAQKARLLA